MSDATESAVAVLDREDEEYAVQHDEQEREERWNHLAERFRAGERLSAEERTQLLGDLELYRGVPVFRDAPARTDPRRKLINLNLISQPEHRLEWLKRQARCSIYIERDESDRARDPERKETILAHVQWNGMIWGPVQKGRPVPVPWPIAEAYWDTPDGHQPVYDEPIDSGS